MMLLVESPNFRFDGFRTQRLPSRAEVSMFARRGKRSVFRGSLDGQRLQVRFRIKGRGTMGLAYLDTGAPESVVSRQFLRASTCSPEQVDTTTLAGILDKDPQPAPVVELPVELIPDEGPPFTATGRVAVNEASGHLDLMIGIPILSMGVLTIDGPRGTWEWVVDWKRIPKAGG